MTSLPVAVNQILPADCGESDWWLVNGHYPHLIKILALWIAIMSDDENSANAGVGQKLQGALQLGPRKKPWAVFKMSLISFCSNLFWDRPTHSPWETLWTHHPCIMHCQCSHQQWYTLNGNTGREPRWNLYPWVHCSSLINDSMTYHSIQGSVENIIYSWSSFRWYPILKNTWWWAPMRTLFTLQSLCVVSIPFCWTWWTKYTMSRSRRGPLVQGQTIQRA